MKAVLSTIRNAVFIRQNVKISSSAVRRSEGSENVVEDPEKNKNFVKISKIMSKYWKPQEEWPKEEQSFAFIDRNFFKKKELRPDRGFSINLPFGMMKLRHLYRLYQAESTVALYAKKGFELKEEEVAEGAKKAFEIIAQSAFQNKMESLVEREICSQTLVKRFTAALEKANTRQKELLNITTNDIYAVAPGPYSIYQSVRPIRSTDGFPYLSYSLLCCALYKKDLLYKSIERKEPEIPSNYGYSCPRIIFGYVTLGNKMTAPVECEDEVRLLDCQIIVI